MRRELIGHAVHIDIDQLSSGETRSLDQIKLHVGVFHASRWELVYNQVQGKDWVKLHDFSKFLKARCVLARQETRVDNSIW